MPRALMSTGEKAMKLMIRANVVRIDSLDVRDCFQLYRFKKD